MKSLKDTRYSILDLAVIRDFHNAADTFRHSVDQARQAEELGYTRYWFAEHHNMEGVGSSATSILIGHVAGKTESIRVGSGGIMLPNHAPLIVAEQFGTLASLYPNRIDLGLGRAPGTDQITSFAIRRENMRAVHNFPEEIDMLRQLFSEENKYSKVRAIPGEGLNVPIWILGSSTDSAHLAAAKGLPYAFASHFAPTYFEQAIEIYRREFRPSAQLEEPYIMACVNVMLADTDREAEILASSVQQMFSGIVTGKREKLKPAVDNIDELLDAPTIAAVEQMLYYSFIGSKETVQQELSEFVNRFGINEVMITSPIYDIEARKKSNELFASIFE